MAVICPTITASDEKGYQDQMAIISHFAKRIHIDLADGIFTPRPLVKPEQAWWPVGFMADFHLMYEHPLQAVKEILKHKPHLIIVHAEAKGSFEEVAKNCTELGVKVGVALLAETPLQTIAPALGRIDHVLVFSGNLGYQGGSHADLKLLQKVEQLRKLQPGIEISWDGGINDQNVADLINAGVDVLNVGGFIQHAKDSAKAFHKLQRIADEAGTT